MIPEKIYLKPCPYCRETKNFTQGDQHQYISKKNKTIECGNCGAEGPPAETIEGAATGWNTRVIRTTQIVRDWQVSMVLSDTVFIETDCNSGTQRRLKKSKCECGEAVLIQRNVDRHFRLDGKRIFYPDSKDDGSCIFRCRNCLQPIDKSVPGAEFE